MNQTVRQIDMSKLRSVLVWYKEEIMSGEWTPDSTKIIEAIDCLLRTMKE
jgi:hypothetical protein